MRQQKLVINVNKHKVVIASIAIFFVAIITGFISESRAYQNGGNILRSDLLIEMARVIKSLSPVISQKVNKNKELPPFFNLPKQVKSTVAIGIVKSLPDGTWMFKQPLTKGETVYYFSKLVSFIRENLKHKAQIVNISPSFTDINKSHWLYEPLTVLCSVGVKISNKNGRLNPDALMKKKEVENISATISDYFSSNLLVLVFDGTKIRIYPKGVASPIYIEDIKMSCNGEKWNQVTKGRTNMPMFNSRQICHISFKHPAFFPTSSFSLLKRESTIAFIKLRRNYANFTKNLLNSKLPDRIENSANAHQRLKQRLAEIKQRNKDNALNFQRNDQDTKYQEPLDNIIRSNNSTVKVKESINFPEPVPEVEVKHINRTKDNQTFQNKIKENFHQPIEEKPLIEMFQGYVVNAKTRKGLKGAVVLISGKYYSTNSKGKFVFEAKRHKSIDITAYSEGYIPLKLKSRAGYKNRPITLAIKPIRVVFMGRVINSIIGSPVARALVKVGNKVTRSSIDGSFKVRGLKPGYHQVSCFLDNYTELHEIIFVDKSNNSQHKLAMKPLRSNSSKTTDEYETYFMNNHDEVSPEALLNQNDAATEYQNWVIDKY